MDENLSEDHLNDGELPEADLAAEIGETLFEFTADSTQQDPEFEDEGFSIEQLGAAYARVIHGTGREEKDPAETPAAGSSREQRGREQGETASGGDPDDALDDDADDACCPVSEQSILEAALFVGAPAGTRLTARKLAALMREVSPKEIRGIVARLNEQYEQQHSACRIALRDGGYQMELVPELESLRDGFMGEVREIKLPQNAIDVLAVVAYHQPVTRQEVDRIWQRPSGGLLSQLVQRNLLATESAAASSRDRTYVTTERFLELLGLESLQDLPQTTDVSDVDDF